MAAATSPLRSSGGPGILAFSRQSTPIPPNGVKSAATAAIAKHDEHFSQAFARIIDAHQVTHKATALTEKLQEEDKIGTLDVAIATLNFTPLVDPLPPPALSSPSDQPAQRHQPLSSSPATEAPRRSHQSRAFEAMSMDEHEPLLLKAMQIELMSQFGDRFLKDYLPHFVQAFSSDALSQFCQDNMASQLATLLAQTFLPPQPPQAAAAAAAAESTQDDEAEISKFYLIGVLGGIAGVLDKTIATEKTRNGQASLLMRMIERNQPLGDLQKKIVHTVLALYAPEIIRAALSAYLVKIQKDEATAFIKQFLDLVQQTHLTNLQDQLVNFLCFFVEHQMKEPIEAAIKALMDRLKNIDAYSQLLTHVRDPLMDCFFPYPTPVTAKTKNILVGVLESIHDFCNTLNLNLADLASTKKTEDEKNKDLVKRLRENLLKKSEIKTEERQDAETFPKKLWEDLFWALFYPETKNDPQSRTPLQKLTVLIVTTLADTLRQSLWTPHALNHLIRRLLKQPLSFKNPFERDWPDEKIFDCSDKQFSQDLHRLISGISNEINKLTFTNGVVKLLVKGLLSIMPDVGDKVQRALSKLSSAGAITLPFLLLTDLFWDRVASSPLPTPLDKKQEKRFRQEEYLATLRAKKLAFPNPDILVHPDAASKAALQKEIEDAILNNPTQLRQIVGRVVPAMPGKVLKLIQKLYRLMNYPGMMDLFLAYLIKGLIDGCSKPTARALP